MSLTKEDAARIREACEAREYSGPGSVATGANGLCVYADELIGCVEIASVDDENMAAFFALAQTVLPHVPDLIDEVDRLRSDIKKIEAALEARAEKAESERDEESERADRWEDAAHAFRDDRDWVQAERDEAREQRDALAAWAIDWVLPGAGLAVAMMPKNAQRILADRDRRMQAKAWWQGRCSGSLSGNPYTHNGASDPESIAHPYRDGGDDDQV